MILERNIVRRMQIIDAYRVFMTHGAAERLYSKETLTKHQDVFRSWLFPLFQDREVESIDRRDVLNLRSGFLKKGIGVYRQYQVIMTLKLFLKFSRTVLGLSTLDPSEVTLPQRKMPEVQFLTNDDIEKVRTACEAHTYSGLRLLCLIEVLLSTGLRISEALSLDREFVDAGQTEIDVIGKGGKKRVVFFDQTAMLWMKRLLSSRSDTSPALFVTTGTFPRRLARADISRFFVRLREKTGITRKLTPHILRHTFCTNLRDHGVDISHIKVLAGHSDIQTTARYYLGVDKDALRKAVRRLDYRAIPPTAVV